jgi:hypothetical protein
MNDMMDPVMFAALVAAITVVAAMLVLGTVALALTVSRRRRPEADPAEHEGHADIGEFTADTLNPSARAATARAAATELERHWASTTAPRRSTSAPPDYRPATSAHSTTNEASQPRQRMASAPPSASRRFPTPVPPRPDPASSGFFAQDDENEGISAFDPALRRPMLENDWTEDEGSTEIFSAHNITDAAMAFVDFDDGPTRLGKDKGPPAWARPPAR